MPNINIILIDELYNIIEALNLNRPNTYSNLLSTIKTKFKNLKQNYNIFYITDNYKEKILSTEEDYTIVNDILYIRNIEELENSFSKLSKSLNMNFENKFQCVICKEIIYNEKPLYCYRCLKLYHQNCLKNWKRVEEEKGNDLNCPACKYILNLEEWEKKIDHEDNMKKDEKFIKIIEEYTKYKSQAGKLFENIFNEIMKIKSYLSIKNKKLNINQLSSNSINDLPNIINEELKEIKNNLKIFFGEYENIIEDNILDNDNDNDNEINIIYKKGKNNKIRIFGEEFVKNNKDKFKMIINKKEYDLREYYKIDNNELKIKLIGINNIENMKCIFAECENLYSLPDISKWDTKNINDMSFIFYKCSNLIELSDISKWNTSHVTNMSGMFSGCQKIKALPNIAKWDIRRVKYMGGIYQNLSSLEPLPDLESSNLTKTDLKYITDTGMFFNCSSLTKLPEISKWEIKNISNIESMFSSCSSIIFLPDISIWNIGKIKSLKNMFSSCSSLKILPDISKWNTENVINMDNMFSFCSSLKSLPDISQWNTENVINMDNMFSFCSSLLSLPDISKWNTKKVTTMEGIFSFCSSLSSLPDISKWNTCNVINMRMMFNYCSKLSSLPDLSKWNINKVINMESMFSFCTKLKSVPFISKWNIAKIFYHKFMFHSCSKSLKIPKELIS